MYLNGYKVSKQGNLKKNVRKYITSEHLPNTFKNVFQNLHKLGIDTKTKHIFYIDSHGSMSQDGPDFISLNTVGAYAVHYGCPFKTLYMNSIGRPQNKFRRYTPFNTSTTMIREMVLTFKKEDPLARSCITHVNLATGKIVQYDMRPILNKSRKNLSTLLEEFGKFVQNEQYEAYVNTCRKEVGGKRIEFYSYNTQVTITDRNQANDKDLIDIIKKAYNEKHPNQYLLVVRIHPNKSYLIYDKRKSQKMETHLGNFATTSKPTPKLVSIHNLETEFNGVINLT
jgi:hypothetical protein